jgi:hypothetical protein
VGGKECLKEACLGNLELVSTLSRYSLRAKKGSLKRGRGEQSKG